MPCSVRIDKQSCLSSKRCVLAEPEAFASDADHLGNVLPDAARLSRERLLEVARACPGLAISVHDEDGNELDLQ